MEHYCHDPLPGQGYIRLATIHPGKFEDDIVVSFHTSTFPNNTLPYEALSYVWGSDKSHTPIHISEDNTATANGSRDVSQMGFKQLWVTQNLDVALRHLRYDETSRVMWTDALCINQTNEVEKGPQVAMMGEIFRLACRVIAWLGPDENDSNRALHLMNYFGSQVEVDFVKQEMRPAAGCTNRSIGDCNIGLPLQDRDVSSIYHLLCRQWFERLWIRQEIYLAGPEAVIMCGLNQVKWSSFRRGLACTYLKHTPNLTEQFNTRMNVLHGFIFQENFNKLMDLDHKYNNTQCLDPRDRLYAVLAMLKDEEKALIPSPDYTQPYDKLYTTVVRNWIESNNSLNILCQCRPNDGTCPSWVPDWSKPDTRSIVFAPYIYMSPFTAWHKFPHPDVLRVIGVSKCVVSEYHQLPQLSNHRNILLEQIRTLLLKVDLEEKHTTKDYTRLLAHDNFPYSFDPPIFNFPDFEVAEQCVEFIMSDRDINGASNKKFVWSSGVRKFLSMIHYVDRCRLIQCTGGYIGVAPALAQPGDEVYTLLGCSYPLLLRPQGNNTFRVIGRCFVLGLAYDEALLGPLPDNIRVIRSYEKRSGSDAPAFRDISSGEVFYEDPRLKSLPVDLEDFRRQVQDNPWANLRVEPDVFRKHGVDLKCIDLV